MFWSVLEPLGALWGALEVLLAPLGVLWGGSWRGLGRLLGRLEAMHENQFENKSRPLPKRRIMFPFGLHFGSQNK